MGKITLTCENIECEHWTGAPKNHCSRSELEVVYTDRDEDGIFQKTTCRLNDGSHDKFYCIVRECRYYSERAYGSCSLANPEINIFPTGERENLRDGACSSFERADAKAEAATPGG